MVDHISLVKTLAATLSALSFIGSLSIILAIVSKRLQDRAEMSAQQSSTRVDSLSGLQTLLLWLSVADLFFSVGFGLSWSNGTDGVCILQAILIEIGAFSGFGYTTVLALELFMVLVRGNYNVQSRIPKYHAFVLLSSLADALIIGVGMKAFGPASADASGPNKPFAWCWVRADKPVARLGLFYLPLLIEWYVFAC